MNQDWNDPKSKLQQCCLTLRSIDGGEPDIPIYKSVLNDPHTAHTIAMLNSVSFKIALKADFYHSNGQKQCHSSIDRFSFLRKTNILTLILPRL